MTRQDERERAGAAEDDPRQGLRRHLAQGGPRVTSQSDFEAVLVRGRRSEHRLHLCLTILTVGLWGPVWLAMWLAHGEKREIASVDEYGKTAVTGA